MCLIDFFTADVILELHSCQRLTQPYDCLQLPYSDGDRVSALGKDLMVLGFLAVSYVNPLKFLASTWRKPWVNLIPCVSDIFLE